MALTTRRVMRAAIGVLMMLVAVPGAHAQIGSGISGVVRDASGGVLPGVTVRRRARSLIEGSRTTVTDANGTVPDHRPAARRLRRHLHAAGLPHRPARGHPADRGVHGHDQRRAAVGQLEESITVTGESPLVDVRNSVSQSVMNRETLDTIPTGKDPFAVGQLIPGVTTTTPDVGGTQIMQQPTLQVHGSSNNDNVFMVDNVQIQHIGFGGNQTGFYFNDGLMEEISYQTSSLPAEAPVGGVQINMIPRDGGNEFHGTLFATGGNDPMQSNNLDDELVALGFTAQNRVESIYDFNATFGGPIMRDRLWFFSTYPPLVRQQLPGQHLRRHRRRRPLDDQRITDGTLRLTVAGGAAQQAVAATTIAAPSGAATGRTTGSARASTSRSRRSSRPPASTTSAKSNGARRSPTGCSPNSRCSRCRSTTTSRSSPTRIPTRLPPSTRFARIVTGVSPRQDTNTARMFTYAGFMSYVTGAHNLKAGLQVRTGWSEELFETREDIVQIVTNGVPQSVRLVNNPSGHLESGVNTGIYVQDSWTFGRVTINPGLRYERFTMSIPAAKRRRRPLGAGARLRGAGRTSSTGTRCRRASGCRGIVFGDGRTAVKGGLSRYDRLAGITIVQPLNGKNIAFQTCPWGDTNGDLRAQNRRDRDCALHGIPAAEPRLRRRRPEAAAPVGIHRHRCSGRSAAARR